MTKEILENKIKEANKLFPYLKQLTFSCNAEEYDLLEREFNSNELVASPIYSRNNTVVPPIDKMKFQYGGIEVTIIRSSFIPVEIIIRK